MIKSDRSVRVKKYLKLTNENKINLCRQIEMGITEAISVCIVKGGALADVAEHLKEALENVRILDSHYAAKLIKQTIKENKDVDS